jgi:hypothetical protein
VSTVPNDQRPFTMNSLREKPVSPPAPSSALEAVGADVDALDDHAARVSSAKLCADVTLRDRGTAERDVDHSLAHRRGMGRVTRSIAPATVCGP